MKGLILICCFSLASCQSGQATAFGERVGEVAEVVETSLCPLTTMQNVERVAINALNLVPFFAGWEPVCKD